MAPISGSHSIVVYTMWKHISNAILIFLLLISIRIALDNVSKHHKSVRVFWGGGGTGNQTQYLMHARQALNH